MYLFSVLLIGDRKKVSAEEGRWETQDLLFEKIIFTINGKMKKEMLISSQINLH